jgi:hypothetical protein
MECLVVIIVADNDWCIVVAKCEAKATAGFLVDFYRFAKGMDGVRNLYFLVRDHVENDVVFIFRILVDPGKVRALKSKISYKLKSLLPEGKYAIDPRSDNLFSKYAALSAESAAKIGKERFLILCDFLGKLSETVVEMAEKKFFNFTERAEMVHTMASMLGCTEYGMLTKNSMEVGYFDRIEKKYLPYLKEIFKK